MLRIFLLICLQWCRRNRKRKWKAATENGTSPAPAGSAAPRRTPSSMDTTRIRVAFSFLTRFLSENKEYVRYAQPIMLRRIPCSSFDIFIQRLSPVAAMQKTHPNRTDVSFASQLIKKACVLFLTESLHGVKRGAISPSSKSQSNYIPPLCFSFPYFKIKCGGLFFRRGSM